MRSGEGANVATDALFAMGYALEGATSTLAPIKARKGAYARPSRELARQRAEESAAHVIRHRIQENERRYPEIFAAVRDPDFLRQYEAACGEPWSRMYETDINAMRARVLWLSEILAGNQQKIDTDEKMR